MGKTARDSSEIEKIRNQILDHALDIIGNEGYDALSMRGLGSRMHCAAKTIYNYYSCKEEICQRVLTRGFELLIKETEEAVADIEDSLEYSLAFNRAYLRFGMNHANYYNIMFNVDTPKSTDYIGTSMESVAHEKRIVVDEYINRTKASIKGLIGKECTEEELVYHLTKLWSTMHGLISLYNSRSMKLFDERAVSLMTRIADDLIMELKSLNKEG